MNTSSATMAVLKGVFCAACTAVLLMIVVAASTCWQSIAFHSNNIHMVKEDSPGVNTGHFKLYNSEVNTTLSLPPHIITLATGSDTSSHVPPTGSRNLELHSNQPVSRNETMRVGVQNQDYRHTGYLNYDLWHWIVGYLVDDMRIVREFPLHPDERKNISNLHVKFNESDPNDLRGRYGHKVYGYITPPKPGPYSFLVELSELTAAAEVELWVSTTTNPHNISLILNLLHDDLSRSPKVSTRKSSKSKEVELGSGPHYFEFFQKAFDGSIVTDVKWRTPESQGYVSVPSNCFTMAAKLNESGDYASGQSVQFLLDGSLPSESHMTHHRLKSVSTALLPITDLDVLPKCYFKALYALPRHVPHKKGFYQVHKSMVFPKDETWFNNYKKKDQGNGVISIKLKDQVVKLYTEALKTKKGQNALVHLRHMEQTTNKNDGSRFLLEMDVQLHQPKEETVHTSEYVYLKKGSSQLCHTSNFQWTKDTYVHFVISVKNLGQWVVHLIYNMEDIYAQTGDERFGLIIVDYNSEDMNIMQEAKKSSFKRIEVYIKNESFSRAGGLQEAINHVKNPNDIIVTLDMHLTLPYGFVEFVRKRTIQHKMALTPMFFKFNKGYTEINYNGAWGIWSYGIFSMYKSDWIKMKGFNTAKYTTKWGDEDWDVLDRALSVGVEAYRIRIPGFVHYHHSKKGMWGNKEINFEEQHWTVYS